MSIDGEISQKERSLNDNDDIGNIFMHRQLTGLSVGQNITVSLKVLVEAGETLIIRDESVASFETSLLSIESIGNSPIANPIITPVNNSDVVGLTPIIWNRFSDPDNDIDNCTVNLYDNNLVLNESIENTTSTDTTSSFNFTTVNEDFYNIVVECFDSFGRSANSSVNVENVFLTPIEINLTIPLNNSLIDDSFNIDFTYDVNFNIDCELSINSTANQTMSALIGENSFPSVSFSNSSNSWDVRCFKTT